MIFDRFERLLKKAMGLDAASIGSSAVMRAVESRARACDIADTDAYWEHVFHSAGELQSLVEAVAVPETWFFRDREAFSAAVRLVTAEWLPRRKDGAALKVLSLPCSTGEEPYTLAMSFLDAGFQRADLQIDGIDISRQSLEVARKAIYGSNSFRGDDLAFRGRHFSQVNGGYKISEKVRQAVRFSQGNLFELCGREGGYDVLFCRNLLIYFDGADQRRAVGVLRRLLAPNGLIFVGHSEASLMLGEGFASARVPLAFAFRQEPEAESAKAVPAWPRFAPKPVVPAAPIARKARVARPVSATAAVPVKAAKNALESIHDLADRGDIEGALKLAEDYLRAGKPTPDALHLLGVISDAAGNPGAAIAYYRKALYLDPGHQDALAHVALLLERQGDRSGAQRMRERAGRVVERVAR